MENVTKGFSKINIVGKAFIIALIRDNYDQEDIGKIVLQLSTKHYKSLPLDYKLPLTAREILIVLCDEIGQVQLMEAYLDVIHELEMEKQLKQKIIPPKSEIKLGRKRKNRNSLKKLNTKSEMKVAKYK